MQLARAGANTYAVYMGLLTQGHVALAKDELDRAAKVFEEGLTLARRAGDRRYTAYMISGLGAVAHARGQTAEARRQHNEALEIRTTVGGQTEAAENNLALARIAADEGHPEAAGEDVRAALDAFKARGLAADESYAWAVQAAVSLASKRMADAGQAADRAERLLPRVQTVGRRLWITIQIARVRAAGDRADTARAALHETAGLARRQGFLLLEQEARRAMAALTENPRPAR
jgi:tetratricopeptide (TPR) repeat protein